MSSMHITHSPLVSTCSCSIYACVVEFYYQASIFRRICECGTLAKYSEKRYDFSNFLVNFDECCLKTLDLGTVVIGMRI